MIKSLINYVKLPGLYSAGNGEVFVIIIIKKSGTADRYIRKVTLTPVNKEK